MHKTSLWASIQSSGPSFFSIITKLNSIAWAQVIGPEGGAADGVAGAGLGEGAADYRRRVCRVGLSWGLVRSQDHPLLRHDAKRAGFGTTGR
jgi:hypothetical protein